jgi:hypothetical protein
MEITGPQQKLKQVQFIFWMSLAMALFSFSVFMKSFDSHLLWKIICSGVGFAIFWGLATLLLMQMLKLRKKMENVANINMDSAD